jgi:hypothetical protein
MRERTVTHNVEGTFVWPFCTNFAVDEALGKIEENILLGGTIQHQRKNHLQVAVKLGLEQALAPVREPDTFAEGAWENLKVTKTEGTFDFISQTTILPSFYKNYISV